jgi:phenylacetate-CoA ligase
VFLNDTPRSDHTRKQGAAEATGIARMSADDVLGGVDELAEGTSGSVDAVTRAAIGPHWGSRIGHGIVEDVVIACESSDERMRVSPDAGILELVEASGHAISAGEPGYMVGTRLTNRSQILIRYRAGDVGVMDTRPDPPGLGMPILAHVVGCQEHPVVLAGRRSVRFDGLFRELPEVLEAQVIQGAMSRLGIRVVAPGGLSKRTTQAIRRRAQHRLTDEIKVDVERVVSIPRPEAGKFLAVVSLFDSTLAP